MQRLERPTLSGERRHRPPGQIQNFCCPDNTLRIPRTATSSLAPRPSCCRHGKIASLVYCVRCTDDSKPSIKVHFSPAVFRLLLCKCLESLSHATIWRVLSQRHPRTALSGCLHRHYSRPSACMQGWLIISHKGISRGPSCRHKSQTRGIRNDRHVFQNPARYRVARSSLDPPSA